MEKPKIDTGVVYSTVANLMPSEGRDFTIDAAYDASGKSKLIITPLTPIGAAWVPFLTQALENPMGNQGVGITQGGSAGSESVTVSSIRAKIENEANEALKAKVKAAEDDHHNKYEAAKAAREAQDAAGGKGQPPNDAVRAANRASNDASVVSYRMHRIANKVPAIRAEVDKAALEAAKKDLADGKNWSVDMNAPLTSLFDEQDVAEKFRDKERLILDMAEKSVAMDDVMERAVHTSKQYILPKEG